MTETYVSKLKLEIEKLPTLSYEHGSIRGTFVSTSKHFKTTIFGSSKTEIENILQQLFFFVNEPFNEKNLSITVGQKRDFITRRNTKLKNISVFTQDYNSNFEAKFYRVALLVHGLEKPIILLAN